MQYLAERKGFLSPSPSLLPTKAMEREEQMRRDSPDRAAPFPQPSLGEHIHTVA